MYLGQFPKAIQRVDVRRLDTLESQQRFVVQLNLVDGRERRLIHVRILSVKCDGMADEIDGLGLLMPHGRECYACLLKADMMVDGKGGGGGKERGGSSAYKGGGPGLYLQPILCIHVPHCYACEVHSLDNPATSEGFQLGNFHREDMLRRMKGCIAPTWCVLGFSAA